MNTNQEVPINISEDIQKELESLFPSKEVKEEELLALSSHEDSTKIITEEQKNRLSGLGFENVVNVKKFNEKKDKTLKLSAEIEILKEVESIKNAFSTKLISYNQLCNICNKYDLYFASSSLFKGEIPHKNVKELEAFNFEKLRSNYRVLNPDANEGITTMVDAYKITTMIVAPINQFILENVLITRSREIVKFPTHNEKLKNSCNTDPIVLVPIKIHNEIFFVVVTYWNLI